MPLFIYITCASEDEAERIASALLDERLIACANILPGMRSLYLWKGRREQAQETALICKTMTDRLDALTEKIRELHSYETPCVTVFPITGGNPDFLAWIEESTRPLP